MKHLTTKVMLLPLAISGALMASLVLAGPANGEQQQSSSAPTSLSEPVLSDVGLDIKRVPDMEFRQLAAEAFTLAPTPDQQQELANFLDTHTGATARWDQASGSIDMVYGFAELAQGNAPEAAARAFLASHGDLFGSLNLDDLVLDGRLSREALGGHLLRFNQTYQSLPVVNAGIGVVLDGNGYVRALSGPFWANLDIDTQPLIGDGHALDVATADLAGFALDLPTLAQETLAPAWAHLENQLGVLATPHPELKIYATADGGRLVWQFFRYSHNPFGMFLYTVDAHSGEVLAREDFVRTVTADVFPTSPPITDALKERGALLDANGEEIERPLGQVRVELRNFDAGNAVTGTADVLSGKHALITNTLVTRQPFTQAALDTYHFDRDELPLKGRTDEVDQLAEPAEHQDAISQFFYINTFIEYLDYLHRAGDAVHSRGVGEGSFPDSYPNDDTPLSGTVHIPNVLAPPTDQTDPDFVQKLLALDNAFAVPISTEIAGQEVVVNPTAYGHGFLFNNLAIDFAVPLHEGTHATITPIAGLEGSPEGGALNEGQADIWAYTIGENPTLGSYIVNAFRLRELLSERGTDPDTVQWIRHADSQLRYSQLGTDAGTGGFEVHQDGEIYAGALWDLRQLMLEYRTSGTFLRPNQITGEATDAISQGKELFERMFLGSMYVLGTVSPDTFVRARDALIIADDVLHPSDALDPASPGRHRALIERVFANRELGVNAAAPVGGRQTISTAVSAFTANVAAPPAPQGVTAEPTAVDTVTVRWEPVTDAFAYEVLKRRIGVPTQRLFLPGEQRPGLAPGRDYLDGDTAFSGFSHVEYVFGGSFGTYQDRGQWFDVHAALGLESPNFEYVVRAIARADSDQVAFSDLSATAPIALATVPVTDYMEARIANVSFQSGVFSFDQTLRNLGGAGSFDGTVFEPIVFKILDISEDSVTVANADNGGSGQNGDEAQFVYAETLEQGQTSAPQRLEFDDPGATLFTFDAEVTGQVRSSASPANGSQDPVETAEASAAPEEFSFEETFTGVVPIGSTGLNLVQGVDHVDVSFTAKPSAVSVNGILSADPNAAGAFPDLDFELRDSNGNVLATSGNLGPNESVGSGITGGDTYTYRVIGWANGPTIFRIDSEQSVTDPDDAGTGSGGAGTSTGSVTRLLRFTVNPLTGVVSISALQ